MVGLEHYILTFLVAFVFTLTELLSNEYPMTFRFLKKSKSLYGYGASYGLTSIAFLWTMHYLGLYSCLMTTIFGNIWVQAIVMGLITKALLHVSIFRADSIPIGLETFANIFEPRLLKQIGLDEYNARQRFVRATQARYPILDVVLALMTQNVPRNDLILAETFLADLDYKLFVEFSGESDETKIIFAMNMYLVEFGIQTFEITYP